MIVCISTKLMMKLMLIILRMTIVVGLTVKLVIMMNQMPNPTLMAKTMEVMIILRIQFTLGTKITVRMVSIVLHWKMSSLMKTPHIGGN